MADEPSKEYRQAEAKLKKEQRVTEGAKAMAEYNAEREAERAKTARLKELRLAEEMSDKVKATKTKKEPAARKSAQPEPKLDK